MNDHGFLKWKRKLAKVSATNLNGGVVRPKYETEWETVDHWHARGGELLSNDWLKYKKKQVLITSGTCVTSWWRHALEMILYKNINVLVWTNGVSWTILDDWRYKVYEGWASFWKSSHVAGSNGNLIKKLRMNIQQRWRHHADLPLLGVQNSHPMSSNMVQPRQGSWRMDTGRK